METLSSNSEAQVKVFVTKSRQFRAKIKEPGEPPYEVTVGGKSWSLGKGREYEDRIVHKLQYLVQQMTDKLAELTQQEEWETFEIRTGKYRGRRVLGIVTPTGIKTIYGHYQDEPRTIRRTK